MTFLNLINKVLLRLRETQAVDVNDSDYVQLVGILVNDAKNVVQNAWDWSALRTTLTVAATVGVNSYTLTGSGQDFKVLDAYNDTSDAHLKYISPAEMNTKVALQTAAVGTPEYFSYNGLDSNGDQNILVYPTPDGSYTLKFDCVVREAELTSASDSTKLPSQPVEMLAWAMAVRERGESGGTSGSELFALADRALGDSVALDAHRYHSEMTWRVV